MLTPVDIQNKMFKGGIGYDKRDIDLFMEELSSDYAQLYRSNVESRDKITALNESLQHYRSIEDSMKKALTLSKKTAEETVNAANDKARQISLEAEIKADAILAEANVELQEIKDEIFRLQQQHAVFKKQFSKILKTQLKIMDNEMIDIDLGYDFEPSPMAGGFGNFPGYGFNGGGLGSGGYYPGASFDMGRERTNQDPTVERGPLNMDPFADAMNGGGRFTRHYSGSNKKAARDKYSSDSTKSGGLHVKEPTSNSTRVRRNFTNPNVNTYKPNSDTTSQNNVSNIDDTNAQQRTNTKPISEDISATARTSTSDSYKVASDITNQTTFEETTHVSGEVETKAKKSNILDSDDNHTEGFDFIAESSSNDQVKSQNRTSYSDDTITGEVEDKIKESHMLDSEDNYGDALNFVQEDTTKTSTRGKSSNTKEEDTYTGDVEDKVKESHMLDSADNYDDGLDFIAEDTRKDISSNTDEETYAGEVEDKIKESHMLDSADNYDNDFNFVAEDTSHNKTTSTNEDDDVYAGEVEDKIKESAMLDSADNYSDDFDFVVSNDLEDEIPTILSFNSKPNNGSKNDDILEGDVEVNIKKSNLIGNYDNNDEGFNFL